MNINHRTIVLILCLIFNSLIYSYSENSKGLPKLEESSKGYNVIRYSNVIVNYNQKTIIIPIYGGIYGDITYENLREQQKKNNYIFNLFVPAEKGKVEETFLNVINFYKKTIFKKIDISQPTEIGNEGSWIIWYDFNCEDIPCSMMIFVGFDQNETIKRQKKYRYKEKNNLCINMLGFDENSPGVGILIHIGKSSPFKK